jgi:hypothetical protein
MYPSEFVGDGDSFVVNLIPDFTQCKALTRSQTCGTTSSEKACCGVEPENQVLELVAADGAVCKPACGCC